MVGHAQQKIFYQWIRSAQEVHTMHRTEAIIHVCNNVGSQWTQYHIKAWTAMYMQYTGWGKNQENSHFKSIIWIIFAFNTNPENFNWSDSIGKWWSYGHQTIYFQYLGQKSISANTKHPQELLYSLERYHSHESNAVYLRPNRWLLMELCLHRFLKLWELRPMATCDISMGKVTHLPWKVNKGMFW